VDGHKGIIEVRIEEGVLKGLKWSVLCRFQLEYVLREFHSKRPSSFDFSVLGPSIFVVRPVLKRMDQIEDLKDNVSISDNSNSNMF